jgi:hypothetical protein
MAVAAVGVLIAAGVAAASVPGGSLACTILALMLLGLGWNFGLISGTALVVDATTTAERARTQGTIDVLVAFPGAGAGALSGIVVAQASYAVLALGSAALSFAVIPVLLARGAGRVREQEA